MGVHSKRAICGLSSIKFYLLPAIILTVEDKFCLFVRDAALAEEDTVVVLEELRAEDASLAASTREVLLA